MAAEEQAVDEPRVDRRIEEPLAQQRRDINVGMPEFLDQPEKMRNRVVDICCGMRAT